VKDLITLRGGLLPTDGIPDATVFDPDGVPKREFFKERTRRT